MVRDPTVHGWPTLYPTSKVATSFQRLFHDTGVAREKSGEGSGNPGRFFTDDEWAVVKGLTEDVVEVEELTSNGVPVTVTGQGGVGGVGGDAGVVQLIQGDEGVAKDGGAAVVRRAEGKVGGRGSAPSSSVLRAENRRNRNGVPVAWDGAAVSEANIVAQPRNRELLQSFGFLHKPCKLALLPYGMHLPLCKVQLRLTVTFEANEEKASWRRGGGHVYQEQLKRSDLARWAFSCALVFPRFFTDFRGRWELYHPRTKAAKKLYVDWDGGVENTSETTMMFWMVTKHSHSVQDHKFFVMRYLGNAGTVFFQSSRWGRYNRIYQRTCGSPSKEATTAIHIVQSSVKFDLVTFD
eukprot:g13029.t1